MMSATFESALEGIKVLDLTEGRGLYAGKMLADFGADVIKIEPPGGSPARQIPPFKDDIPGPENSLYFVNFNTNKRGIILNLDSSAGKDIFKRLVTRSDVVIEDFPPGTLKDRGLDHPILRELNRKLILASVTAFGPEGPFSRFAANDMVSFAAGGIMHGSGAEKEPPVVAPDEQAYQAASIIAVYGILSALFLRLRTGEGQIVQVSNHEVVESFSQGIMRYSVTSSLGGRSGSQFWAAPARIYPCKDGYVHLLVFYPQHWRAFLELLGNPETLTDKMWYDAGFRAKNRDLIDPMTEQYTATRTKDEITRACQARGIPCTPVNTPADNARNPHFIQRGSFTQVEHPVLGKHMLLAPPYRMSETPGVIRRPAPLLGQHNREVLSGLGYTEEEMERLKTDGVI
jgi:benzylsuccinate CoA-transferase BbsE subunit